MYTPKRCIEGSNPSLSATTPYITVSATEPIEIDASRTLERQMSMRVLVAGARARRFIDAGYLARVTNQEQRLRTTLEAQRTAWH